jgi:hypothetical protein
MAGLLTHRNATRMVKMAHQAPAAMDEHPGLRHGCIALRCKATAVAFLSLLAG